MPDDRPVLDAPAWTWVVMAVLAFLIVVGVAVGWDWGSRAAQQVAAVEQAQLLEEIAADHEEVKIVHVREVSTLNEALLRKDGELADLAQLVTEIDDPPVEVRYIVRTETQLEPVERTVLVTEIPDEHYHRLSNGLIVAAFTHTDDGGYRFDTYRQGFRGKLALGDTSAALLLEVSSDAQPDLWLEVPVDELVVDRVTPDAHKVVGVDLALGVVVSLPVPQVVVPDLGIAVQATFLHPRPDLDVLGLRVGGSPTAFRVGIDAVGYNVGAPLPVIDDLWLSAGASWATTGSFGVDLMVSTKL